MCLRYSEKGFKGVHMDNTPWWHWAVSFSVSLLLMTLSFCRSNSEELFGIQKIDSFYWWLFVGWLTTYLGVENWQFTKGQLGAFHALVFFTVVEVVYDVIMYSLVFGFKPKYAIAVILVALAVFIISMPDSGKSKPEKIGPLIKVNPSVLKVLKTFEKKKDD
jgi:hypothetical protein